MCSEKITLEPVERRVEEELGRELTPREKFYLALAEACTPSSNRSQEVEYKLAEPRSEAQQMSSPLRE
jgi:hypothetical protein